MVSCSKISRRAFGRTTFFWLLQAYHLLFAAAAVVRVVLKCIESMSISRHVHLLLIVLLHVLWNCQIAWSHHFGSFLFFSSHDTATMRSVASPRSTPVWWNGTKQDIPLNQRCGNFLNSLAFTPSIFFRFTFQEEDFNILGLSYTTIQQHVYRCMYIRLYVSP